MAGPLSVMALGPTRAGWGAAALLMIVAGRPGYAQVSTPEMPFPYLPPPTPDVPPPPMPDVSPPSALTSSTGCCAFEPPRHFSLGNQQFDATTAGLRSYLETLRSKDARLYAELDPELHQLEQRRTTAIAVLATGIGIGAASFIYGIAGRDDCPAPSVNDPNFAASTAAWGACNDGNMQRMTAFGLVGLGAMIVGGVVGLAIAPERSDLLGFVNHHNRLSPEPLRLQMGYDPTHRFAYGGAALSF